MTFWSGCILVVFFYNSTPYNLRSLSNVSARFTLISIRCGTMPSPVYCDRPASAGRQYKIYNLLNAGAVTATLSATLFQNTVCMRVSSRLFRGRRAAVGLWATPRLSQPVYLSIHLSCFFLSFCLSVSRPVLLRCRLYLSHSEPRCQTCWFPSVFLSPRTPSISLLLLVLAEPRSPPPALPGRPGSPDVHHTY